MIKRLLDRRPPDVDANTWGTAWSWLQTAYSNICFSPDYVPHDELRLFLADLEERLRGPVELTTWDWVWDRLGQTGPHGRSYQQKYEPGYRLDIREHLEAAQKRQSGAE